MDSATSQELTLPRGKLPGPQPETEAERLDRVEKSADATVRVDVAGGGLSLYAGGAVEVWDL